MDPTLLQMRDHENDTEDLPENMDPQDVHLRDQDGGWLNPDQVHAQIKLKEDESSKWN
jgi:hypothetical protein